MTNTHTPYLLIPASLRVSLLTLGCCLPLMAEEPTLTLTPATGNNQFGSGYAVVGDLDGDGVPDLAVSDPGYQSGSFFSSGMVYIISGVDGSILRTHGGTPANGQAFGAALAALDADGDGVADLAVGAPGGGTVTIHSGVDGSVIAVLTVPGTSQFGSSLANAGDQTGDGRDDLFVGAPNTNSRGAVYVLSADGTVIRSHQATAFGAALGLTVAAIGDIDGDGRADLVAGSPGVVNQAGRVLIYRSSDGGIEAQLTGGWNFNRLGESLAVVPDTDGDGFPDVMAGSFSGGTALVLSGSDLSLLEDLTVAVPANRAVHVGGSFDFDGDGIGDWLIGSPSLNHDAVAFAGGIRIVSGADQSTLLEFLSQNPLTDLGINPRVLPEYGFAAGERGRTNPAGGRGYVHLWRIETVKDSDGDGIPDDEDLVPDSIMDPTVILSGIDSGVENRVDPTGTTLADRFAVLGNAGDYPQPAHFIKPAHALARELHKVDLLTKQEAEQIHQAAVRAMKAAR